MKSHDFFVKFQSVLESNLNFNSLDSFLNDLPSMVLIISRKDHEILYRNESEKSHVVFRKHEDTFLNKYLSKKNDKEFDLDKEDYFIVRDIDLYFAFLVSMFKITFKQKECILFYINDASSLYQKIKNDMKILENERHTLIDKEIELKNISIEHMNLLSSLSHEIRTPMNSILGYSKLLESSLLNDDQKDYTSKIISASNHLMHLVNHIMDFAKLESGKISVEKKPFKISHLFDEVKSMTYDVVKQKNIYFDINQNVCSEIYIGDFGKIKQILINFVSNAIKFTDQGGVTLSCNIHEKINEEQIKLAIHVKDTGIGMTKEQINVIFQPYIQASDSTTRRYGGTGLGLAICNKLANLLEGSITVKSILNEGSEFTLIIPLDVDVNEHTKKYLEDTLDQKSPKKGSHILVAEDNPLSLKLAERILNNMGMNVTLAKDGLEVLNHIKHQPFDLIIMDLKMPHLDGIETTKQIRQTDIKIPIIALTANTFLEDRVKALESGMNDYITKPLDSKSLYQALSHWIPEK
jgi:two-component system autoinducer 2 sensor kinase/phosphatase LuxQ